MNILIACDSREVTTINLLKEGFTQKGLGTIVTAPTAINPALYATDKAYIVPSGEHYIMRLLEICHEDRVRAILPLTGTDFLAIAAAAEKFRRIGVFPLISEYETAQLVNDRCRVHAFMLSNGIRCVRTYPTIQDFQAEYDNEAIGFPVSIMPRNLDSVHGSTMRCADMDELVMFLSLEPDFIIREILDGPEYDIDIYVDTITRTMVSIFAKERLVKIAGTATGLSFKDNMLFSFIEDITNRLGAVGPLNIEVIRFGEDYYVSEVNLRFGGSYMFAHGCGVDFGDLIRNNIDGIANPANIGNYEADVLIMKYDDMIFKTEEELLE